MSEYDLAETRALIKARRERAAEVKRLRDELDVRAATGEAAGWKKTPVRCTRAHRKNGRPKIADVIDSGDHLLFVSKIPWLASDELTLRPWEREQMLGTGLNDVTLDRYMTDDDALRAWLATLDTWQAEGRLGRSPGPRVIKSVPSALVVELIEAPAPLGSRRLWLRCPRHPDDAEQYNPPERFTATRRGDAAQFRPRVG